MKLTTSYTGFGGSARVATGPPPPPGALGKPRRGPANRAPPIRISFRGSQALSCSCSRLLSLSVLLSALFPLDVGETGPVQSPCRARPCGTGG